MDRFIQSLKAESTIVAGVASGIVSYSDVPFGFLPDFDFERGLLIALELAFALCVEVLLVVTGVAVAIDIADRELADHGCPIRFKSLEVAAALGEQLLGEDVPDGAISCLSRLQLGADIADRPHLTRL